jgi:hypothetical protein
LLLNPFRDAETATEVVPEPGEVEHGSVEPYEVDVPYSNLQSVTVFACGLTVALRVAELDVTSVAGFVATVGGFDGGS